MALSSSLGHFEILARRTLVGAIYVSICMLGVLAAFFPMQCKTMFQKSQNPLPIRNKNTKFVQIKGHHPDCNNYSGNKVRIGNRMFCAACAGLVVGAAIALVGASLYFFASSGLNVGNVWLLVAGEACMILGLLQIKFAGYSKVAMNMALVVGSFVVLIEADAVSKNLLVDLFALGLIAFLLWLRILLSELNNKRICDSCQSCF